jgi:hypothetical protein
MNSRTSHRWMAFAAVLCLLAVTQAANPAPALALPGLIRVDGNVSSDSVSPKTAVATCPAGTWVVGGGGWAYTTVVADDGEVVLTRLEPVHSRTSAGSDSYVVTGAEVAGGYAGNWGVDAFALCASPPSGYEIVSGSTPWSSSSTQEAVAVCSSGRQVIGTGGQINNPNGEVSLIVARSASPRDISRAMAREDANGNSGNWNITAYAVCTNALSGFTALYGGSTLTGSENVKFESLDCPLGTNAHNVGATLGSDAPPGVAIIAVVAEGGRAGHAVAAETTPTNASWGLLVQLICGP